MYCYRHHNPGKEVIVSEAMSLTQFVERYAKDLPLQIKVLRGYCGSTARLTSKYMSYLRDKGPMGSAPYIGPRLGDGPIFIVAVSQLDTKECPGKWAWLRSLAVYNHSFVPTRLTSAAVWLVAY
jgi:hypothetical protein